MRCTCRHNDFGNNTVLFPARNPLHWAQPEEVQSILYYGDFDGDDSNHAGGGTAFAPVSRTILISMTMSWSGQPQLAELWAALRQDLSDDAAGRGSGTRWTTA